MIEFNSDSIEDLEIEAQKRAHEVSVEVTKSVISALEQGADKVIVGMLKNVELDLSVEKSGFLEALETNLVRCEEAEEYELCKQSIKWIKKLRE
tara:strand:- start:54 stop:335 length:282 start_codon:yes stop_codon:yes gene_type:complete